MGDEERTGAPARLALAPRDPSRPATRPRRRGSWGRNTLLLLLVFLLVGLVPILVAVGIFGPWQLPVIGPPPIHLPFLNGSSAARIGRPSADPTLPRAVWVAERVGVRTGPGTGPSFAQLDPGFPVTLTAQATVSGRRWDAIVWHGPTPAAGGHGWVPDAALTAAASPGPAVGDPGALSPAVATALAQLGPNAGLAVYYPAAQQLYLAHAEVLCPLGDGARPLVLAAFVAHASSNASSNASGGASGGAAPNSSIFAALIRQIGQGDAAATATAYQQLGAGAGLAAFAASAGLAGIVPGASAWDQTKASPHTLAQFYAALGDISSGPGIGGLDAATRTQLLAALAPVAATGATVTYALPVPSGAHGALVVGTSLQSAGWVVVAAGIVSPPSGPTYAVAACVPGQPTHQAGMQGLAAVFTQLAALPQG